MKTSPAYLGLILAALPVAGQAGLISVVDSASGTGQNLMYNSCTDPGPAAVNDGVVGCLNAQPATYIYVYSNVPLEVQGGGQARVQAVDGNFGTLTLGLFGNPQTFNQLVLNIDAATNGVVDFGNGFTRNVSANGNNFFTLGFAPGVSEFSFAATEGLWADVGQVRITLANGPEPVPEPAVQGLLGLGLLLAAMILRRRQALSR